MLAGFVLIVVAQLAGEILVHLLQWPVPGPVIGLLFMVIGFGMKGAVPSGVDTAADGLLRHLSLLFVPAGVGVLQQVSLMRAEALAIIVTLIVSTAATLTVTALVFNALAARATSEGGAR